MNILFAIGFFISLCCCHGELKVQEQAADQDIVHNEVEKGLSQTSTYLFEAKPYVEKMALADFQQEYLDQLVAHGDGEFETDTTYVINTIRQYDLEFGNVVFYIQGKFIPSQVEFHFYGAFNDADVSYDIYHLPVETSLSLTRYELGSDFLKVYGILANENAGEGSEKLIIVLKRT